MFVRGKNCFETKCCLWEKGKIAVVVVVVEEWNGMDWIDFFIWELTRVLLF